MKKRGGVRIVGEGSVIVAHKMVTSLSPTNLAAANALIKAIDFTGAPNLKLIGNLSFSQCTNLSSVTIPEGVTSIGYSAFVNCTNLSALTLPSTVKTIQTSAFSSCRKLFSASIQATTPPTLTTLPFDMFCTLIVPVECYETYRSSEVWKDYIIAYEGEEMLTCDFDTDSGVLSVRGNSTTLTRGAVCAALDGIENTSVYATCLAIDFTGAPNVTSIGHNAFMYFRGVTSIELPLTLTSIYSWAFAACSSLTELSLPEGVKEIGNNAFYSCEELLKIEIPTSIEKIGRSLFADCTKLREVKLPQTLTEIGSNMFSHCRALTQMEIPANVTSIGDWAFGYCTEMKSVKFNEKLTHIGNSAFYRCYKLAEVTTPSTVVSIDDWAFGDCTSLKELVLNEGVVSIGMRSFYTCTSLAHLTIPSTVEFINSFAFDMCTSLTAVTSLNAIPSITLGDTIFCCVDLDNCTLYVPEDGLAAYRTADQWKDFGTIAPLTTGVANSPLVENSITTSPGKLHLEGVGQPYRVYSPEGKEVYVGQERSVALPRGMYIVVQGGQNHKIWVE